MRWPRQVASLLFLTLLLAGPPLLLVKIVGWPVHGWPTMRQIQLWVAQPLTEQTLTTALGLFAWLVWVFLAYTVTVRALKRMRAGARWLRRMPLPTPLQATATGMAGAAAFGVGANTTIAPPDHPLAVAAGTLDDPGGNKPAATSDDTRDDGVVVAGSWLPHQVAEQVAAAAALVWLRRRRTYVARPHGSPGRDEQDLAPLPATVAAIQAALAADQTRPPPPAGAAPAGTGDARKPLPGPVAGLPPGGAGLVGDGALAAGRGLLVAALLARLRQPSGAAPVVVTRTALTMLLGSAAGLIRQDLPSLRVAATVDDATSFLTSLTDEQPSPAPEQADRHDTRAALGGTAPAVLILDVPPPADRLDGVLATGAVTVVVLGAWPAAVTWHVDATGHTHDPRQATQARPRLCVLDPVATTDLLAVIGHTHPAPLNTHAQHPTENDVALPRPRVPHQSTGDERPPRIRGTAATPSRRLQLRVLGEPAILLDGVPLTIRRSAALQALVFLAIHRDGASRRQLVEAIWPGLPAHKLTGRLYTTLSDLRGTLRSASGSPVIDHADDRYRLNPTYLDTDLWRLQNAARHAATEVTDRATAWQAVIDAYTGDLAAGYTWPWLEPPREATRRHAIDAYTALAALQSDPRRALTLLQGGIRVDPYNEDLHLRAMKALAALGDQQAVSELRDSYTRRLAAAGLEPGDYFRNTAAHLRNAYLSGR
ncbi:hypothetical protein B0E53_05140 [Micromonospora sp. MH33]|uniref:AfsR/SARP family transcriptional regulator n=1 Tax=Micromonospora sp. MH33 TaxID=1945509 RepID=UPI000D1490C0|nr:BTAD domain-containing putative transcriptional regulator [Micromonospora sp. MH33]PSK62943.1 hypothetical protein B0E53_05140 [Micromonospora sp. MH33]